MFDLDSKGKGAIPQAWDSRNIKYSEVVFGALTFDWSKPFDIRDEIGKLPINDQGQSLSCVGQSCSKLAEILNAYETKKILRLSARDIYSRIYAPEGGAFGYKGLAMLVARGTAPEIVVPSYQGDNATIAPTEAFMRQLDNTPFATQTALTYKAAKYAFLDSSIDQFAYAIKNQKGIVFGVAGSNQGWQSAYVRPPLDGESLWYHFLVGIGSKLYNGVKYIIAQNSWSEEFGDKGICYIPESYFAGSVFNGLTLVDLPNPSEKKVMTKEEIKMLQSLEGYADLLGVAYWEGKSLADYLRARIKDKIASLEEAVK